MSVVNLSLNRREVLGAAGATTGALLLGFHFPAARAAAGGTINAYVSVDAAGKAITTIEGLSADGRSHPVQKAWIEENVPQCGYCQSGQIMAAAAFLKNNPKPTDEQIRQGITNLC
ncbi:MAG TPA: 2Fe-2S iron-sulfur cluster-binding protein, partial [Gammaproteobacteria bacterium]